MQNFIAPVTPSHAALSPQAPNSLTSFSHLSDEQLLNETKHAVLEENKAKTYVLHLLAEVEKRRLYSKEFPSLFEFCIKTLKYTSGAAQRRIDTMRAMRFIPEIEEKILSGDLNLTSVSQAQTFFRHEAKAGKKYSVQAKKEVLEKLENKSTRECIKELLAISPNSIPQEKRREITSEKTELKVILDKNLLSKFDKLKALLSHKYPHMTDAELLNEIADIALKKLDPLAKPSKPTQKPKKQSEVEQKSVSEQRVNVVPMNCAAPLLPAPEVTKSRYISVELTKQVWLKSKSRCEKCSSTHFLEIDHIKPLALGGKTELNNLRLLCRTHNQQAAIEIFGMKHMKRFLASN
jgi:hypothetical protein